MDVRDGFQKAQSRPFSVGAKVRVRPGERDPDFPDIPLGGWSGTVTEFGPEVDGGLCLVQWDKRTLAAMHPIYRKRCDRDGLDEETMWLDPGQLEADDGRPVPIEQPTQIVTKPLSPKDQDDRVHMALGLTHDDPLPAVSREMLLRYQRYLSAELQFPFPARLPGTRNRQITWPVSGLRGPDDGDWDEEIGLVALGDILGEEVDHPLDELLPAKKGRNAKLIADYAYWFHNWPKEDEPSPSPFRQGKITKTLSENTFPASCAQESVKDSDRSRVVSKDEPAEDAEAGASEASSRWADVVGIVISSVEVGLLGAATGAAIGALRGGWIAALIGVVALIVLGLSFIDLRGLWSAAVRRRRPHWFRRALIIFIVLGPIGAVAGVAVRTLPWSLIGGVLGLILGRGVAPTRSQKSAMFSGMLIGLSAGIAYSVFRLHEAWPFPATIIGAIACLVVYWGFVALAHRFGITLEMQFEQTNQAAS